MAKSKRIIFKKDSDKILVPLYPRGRSATIISTSTNSTLLGSCCRCYSQCSLVRGRLLHKVCAKFRNCLNMRAQLKNLTSGIPRWSGGVISISGVISIGTTLYFDNNLDKLTITTNLL